MSWTQNPPKRVSELLPSLDTGLDADIKAEAAEYVCPDCGKADPDPILGLLDGQLVFACPNCSPAAQVPEGWRIVGDNGTYYKMMTGIGPCFGASRAEAAVFPDRVQLSMEMGKHWAFATCQIEKPDGTILEL